MFWLSDYFPEGLDDRQDTECQMWDGPLRSLWPAKALSSLLIGSFCPVFLLWLNHENWPFLKHLRPAVSLDVLLSSFETSWILLWFFSLLHVDRQILLKVVFSFYMSGNNKIEGGKNSNHSLTQWEIMFSQMIKLVSISFFPP